MKFVYVDESGDQGQSDIFVMAGLFIDAYRLRKCTAAFDEMIKAFLKKHPKAPQELTTKAFINGANKWSEVDADDRKQFLEDVCHLAADCARIFAVAFSFDDFKKAVLAGYKQPRLSIRIEDNIAISPLLRVNKSHRLINSGGLKKHPAQGRINSWHRRGCHLLTLEQNVNGEDMRHLAIWQEERQRLAGQVDLQDVERRIQIVEDNLRQLQEQADRLFSGRLSCTGCARARLSRGRNGHRICARSFGLG